MVHRSLSSIFAQFNRYRNNRNVQNLLTIFIVVVGPALALLTLFYVNIIEQEIRSQSFRAILLADVLYVIIIASLVIKRIAIVVAARRAKSAGSRLHLRLTGVFAILALIPTILVAIFAMITINFGLEEWFSSRVSNVVKTSHAAALAYETEHEEGLRSDAITFASALDARYSQVSSVNPAILRLWLSEIQPQIQRGFREAYIINSSGKLILRGERSYEFNFEAPPENFLNMIHQDGIVIIKDWANNEFRAIKSLDSYKDKYLYVSRIVDGSILNLLDETQRTVKQYQQHESNRSMLLLDFAIIYVAFSVLLILAAVWVGLWFAERIAKPVGQLAAAAQRVGSGDLESRVSVEHNDDEISMLGRVFNQMTKQLKGQRNALLDANRTSEEGRRQFDSVLSGVTSGVIGLNVSEEIDFINPAALNMLELNSKSYNGKKLTIVVPEFKDLFSKLKGAQGGVARKEIQVSRDGKLENLLVRMAIRANNKGIVEGYVVTFDDVTDLVNAQRMAAWGDVARRIAHEIKNPLTPIQLSAERLKEKFMPIAAEKKDILTQYTDVIVRQTGDLRRIVDEFSQFARMPEPHRKKTNLVKIIEDVVHLQKSRENSYAEIVFKKPEPIFLMIDSTMITQALTNLVKNAGEAIEAYINVKKSANYKPFITIDVNDSKIETVIKITDNGIGLPKDRSRLFEPYVTTREKGTGLGLSIVKKIIEEHGGELTLEDAPALENEPKLGTAVTIKIFKN
ncbi:PAS domain-containing sensor histidine kinase [Paracoccaceae bacterium]|nr:PAS domain-containing sensor histidine kinase [Paracoccaceae bacterium]